MEKHVRRMSALLTAAARAAGILEQVALSYDEDRSCFVLPGGGVEVALERENGRERWRVREIYELADVTEGGYRPVSDTVEVVDAGDEIIAARSAVLRVLERRIDAALDEAS